MKYIKKLGIATAMIMLLFSVAMVSCKKDFFEINDPNGLEGAQTWEDEGAAGFFLNRTYALIIPQWPTPGSIHNTSDELNNGSTAFLYGQLVENSVTDIGTGTSITSNRYADIRRCNVAIEGINSSATFSDSSKKVLKGQFFFLRAYAYFKLVRLYGGVPLVLKAQGQGDEDLQVPRSKTSVCIAAMAQDLDSAAAYLPKTWTGNDIGRITRGAALAVKGKVLLYGASPQFTPVSDPAKWTAAYAANKAAYDQCVADGYSLLANYGNIFLTEDNKEVLIVRKYNTSRDLGTNTENITRPYSETTAGSGSNQPTWNLVSAYPMNNGLQPYLANGTVNPLATNYSDTLFWLNRDPRFYASISYNSDVWALSGKAGRKQWTYTGNLDEAGSSPATGFYCKRLCNPSISAAAAVYNSNTGGGSGMDWIEMRFAEVILNLAECAVEVNGGDLTEAKNYVRLIRQRAGIVAGAYDYGLATATTQAAMRDLILTERQVEFAMEGMRYYDLRRTRNLSKLTARIAYKLVCKPPYYPGITRTGALGTDIFLEKSTAGIIPRDTANYNNPAVYTKIFVVPVVKTSLEGNNTIVLPDKYYAYPLPPLFTQTPAIQQTLGWSGGTFNPFD